MKTAQDGRNIIRNQWQAGTNSDKEAVNLGETTPKLALQNTENPKQMYAQFQYFSV